MAVSHKWKMRRTSKLESIRSQTDDKVLLKRKRIPGVTDCTVITGLSDCLPSNSIIRFYYVEDSPLNSVGVRVHKKQLIFHKVQCSSTYCFR